MNTREERGIVIAALCKLTQQDGRWIVPSQSGGEKQYVVNLEQHTCTCPDHQETGFKCKHQWAAEFTVKRELLADGSVVEQKTFTFTEKKTYTQNWPAYDHAQMIEKHRFQVLLADVCKTVPEPKRERKGGRTPHPVSDRIFSVCMKTYTTVSGRRAHCDLADASESGYLTQPMHPAKVSSFFCESELTPILQELVSRTALPLAAVECDFATDSTGFSLNKFTNWQTEKYVEKSGHDWVKVHACVGVKTNCITAAAIYDRNTNDCPILPELVDKTAEGFRMREVSADKGYLSVENVNVISEHGATPFIAPKITSTGGAGGLFAKMVHFYRFNQAEYMEHYHKRSNVESTFSAVKRMFGDAIRAKNEVAMVNEVYAKFICYNLTCLIHSECELGIDTVFFADPPAKPEMPEPTILKFVRPR